MLAIKLYTRRPVGFACVVNIFGCTRVREIHLNDFDMMRRGAIAATCARVERQVENKFRTEESVRNGMQNCVELDGSFHSRRFYHHKLRGPIESFQILQIFRMYQCLFRFRHSQKCELAEPTL